MQHTVVNLDFHSQPLILYGLVCGRSETNKSASLQFVMNLFNNVDNIHPNATHLFDSRTLQGLMQTMRLNNGCIMGCYGEFASFNDNLDKGSSGSSEKARYLSLYSGTTWSMKMKTSGCVEMQDPRFNMIAFTQPYYATQFPRNNQMDGFFQRFLISVPKETYIKIKEKRELIEKQEDLVDMHGIMECIYHRCVNQPLTLSLDDEAMDLYESFHDSVVE